MLRFTSLISLFTFITILAGCTNNNRTADQNEKIVHNPEYGSWQHRNEPIKIDEVQTFGAKETPEEAVISGITYVFVDKQENVYIYDNRSSKLLSFNKEGKLRWVSGQKGRGPGDFENAWTMTWDRKKYMYIANISGSRIDRFNLDGEFVNTLNLPEVLNGSVRIFGYVNDNLLIGKSKTGAFARKLFVVNPNDSVSITHEFTVDLSGELQIPKGISDFSNISIVNDRILIPDLQTYSLTLYNMDSTKIRTITRDFDKIVRPGFFNDESGRAIASFGKINSILQLKQGYYLASASWPLDIDDPDKLTKDLMAGKDMNLKYNNTVDLFDKNWNLLYSIESDERINPELGIPMYVDEAGFLYTAVYEPYPQVKKFKVTVNE